MTLLNVCQLLENTWPAVMVRESPYGFQILVAAHLLGIVLSVGTLLWFDLRLLGRCAQRSRISVLYRGLAPWFLSGFGVMFVSGVILFAAYATSAYGNLFFRIKLAALVLAGANATFYHFTTRQTMPASDDAPRPALPVRLEAISSIVLWTIVILAGRMMSYTMF